MAAIAKIVTGLGLTALLVVGSAAPDGTSTARASKKSTGAVEQAYNEWVLGKGKTPSIYFAEGYEHTGTDGRERNYALLGMTRCQSDGVCIGATFIKAKIRTDRFEIDPAMNKARLTLKRAHVPQKVVWKGEGDPDVGGNPSGGEARAKRSADGRAEMLGRTLRDRKKEHGFVARGSKTDADKDTDGPGAFTVPTPWKRVKVAGLRTSTWAPTNTDRCVRVSKTEKQFGKLANQERAAGGRSTMRMDAELVRVARHHSKEMIKKNTLYHTTSAQFVKRVTGWKALGENVGVGSATTPIHDAFMNSTVHRDNIMHKSWRYFGVGVVKSGGKIWVTVIFERTKNPGTKMSCK